MEEIRMIKCEKWVESEQAQVQFYYDVWCPWWLEQRQHRWANVGKLMN